MENNIERAIAFYTILLAGLGVIVTIDTSYQITLLNMFVEAVLFCVIMFVVFILAQHLRKKAFSSKNISVKKRIEKLSTGFHRIANKEVPITKYALVQIENTGDGSIRCFAKLVKLSIIDRKMIWQKYLGEKVESLDLDAVNPRGLLLQWDDGDESVKLGK